MQFQPELTPANLDDFAQCYLEAAEWTLDDDAREEGVNRWSPDALAEAVTDCAAFQRDNAADLDATGASDGQHGHDLWLTRNRHGAGFWDRGYGDAGERLTKAAHAMGERNAYAGDDGFLYFT